MYWLKRHPLLNFKESAPPSQTIQKCIHCLPTLPIPLPLTLFRKPWYFTIFTYFRRELVLVFDFLFRICQILKEFVFDLSRLSFLLSEEGLGTASGMDFYAITENGFWLLVVMMKRSVLVVASFLDSSLNPFP